MSQSLSLSSENESIDKIMNNDINYKISNNGNENEKIKHSKNKQRGISNNNNRNNKNANYFSYPRPPVVYQQQQQQHSTAITDQQNTSPHTFRHHHRNHKQQRTFLFQTCVKCGLCHCCCFSNSNRALIDFLFCIIPTIYALYAMICIIYHLCFKFTFFNQTNDISQNGLKMIHIVIPNQWYTYICLCVCMCVC